MLINKSKKKISIFIAFCIALSMTATACQKNTGDETDEDVVANVITQAYGESDGTGTINPDSEETQPNGETVDSTDGSSVDGNNVQTGETAVETLTPEASKKIEEIINSSATVSTTVVKPSNIKPDEKYVYNTLTDDEKMLYDAIVSCAQVMRFRLNATSVDKKTWTKVLGVVYNQEPQLFWLDGVAEVSRLHFLEYDSEKIAKMQKEIDTTVAKIMKDADAKSTTFDKLKVFHDYLVKNSKFEIGANTGDYNSSIYSALSGKGGDVQCAGYAKSFKYLCDLAGINCMVVTGTNKSGETHAWNIVDVDGVWYNMDTTWDDPILPVPDSNYIRYQYFLVPDKWIKDLTHFNVNVQNLSSGGSVKYFTPPSCTETSQNYFVKNKKVFSDAASAEKEILAQIDTVVPNKGRVIEIRCETKEVYNAVTKKLKDYQTYAKGKSSSVKGLSDACNENMLLIELDVQYN